MSNSDSFADDVDFALAVYRDQGQWEIFQIEPEDVSDFDGFLSQLRRFPSEVGVLGIISINEEFFVLARVFGAHDRVLLSDASVIIEWPIAAAVADRFELVNPDEEGIIPAGDLAIIEDLGVSKIDLAIMLDDDESYPDEVLVQIAQRLGFGPAFEAFLD